MGEKSKKKKTKLKEAKLQTQAEEEVAAAAAKVATFEDVQFHSSPVVKMPRNSFRNKEKVSSGSRCSFWRS